MAGWVRRSAHLVIFLINPIHCNEKGANMNDLKTKRVACRVNNMFGKKNQTFINTSSMGIDCHETTFSPSVVNLRFLLIKEMLFLLFVSQILVFSYSLLSVVHSLTYCSCSCFRWPVLD